jgi:hypothetical protein
MKGKRNILLTFALIGALAPTVQAITYDASVTPGVIFGTGNSNGSFTVGQANGIELGLRGKMRWPASGTYNSNHDGTYSFDAVVAPGKPSPTAVWSFEWSINSNFDGNGGVLDAYTYLLEIDSNPSQATSFSGFDPINLDTGEFLDHSMGTNSTTSANDSEATNAADYATNIHTYNVAQNSWQAHWFLTSFDPTVDGTYDFKLTAYSGTTALASTKMQIIVGQGGAAVPDSGTTLGLLGLSVAGLGALRRKFRR